MWIVVMGAFAVSGFADSVGFASQPAKYGGQSLVAMATLWFAGIALATANSETLELVMWLTN